MKGRVCERIPPMQTGETAALLQKLIQIPSVNPAGNPGCDPGETGELAIAEFLVGHLQGLGAEVELREVLPGRPNVLAHFPSQHENKLRLLLAPHTDTVSVGGMTVSPFGGEMRDGKIFGRGACDTKGCIAAMLSALAEIGAERLAGLEHEIWFAGLMGEEAGNQGAKALADEMQFDFVVVGEPTELQTVNIHKGAAWLQLETSGLAVHASEPSLGESAILPMIEALRWLRGVLEAELPKFSQEGLTPPTFNIGTIQGGTKSNIVPDRCAASVDMRTIPQQESVGYLTSVIERLKARFPQMQIDVQHYPSLFTKPEHPLIATLEKCGAACVGASWFCDAAIFSGKGMPSVAVGPGSIRQAHTADEWIAVEALEKGVDFYRDFLLQC